MDFSLTPEQVRLRDETVAFARSLSDDWHDLDRKGVFPRETWRRCGEHGLLGLTVPEAYGGCGYDVLSAVLMLEGFGYGCADNGLAFAINSHNWVIAGCIDRFGSEAQRERYLPGLCSGDSIGAFAMSEPGSGSDSFALETGYQEQDDGYLLNGRKAYVTLGPLADVVVVFATRDPAQGRWGVTAFLVDADREGFRATETVEKMGLRSCPMGDVVLDHCLVPEDSVLGREGAGASVFSVTMEPERAFILASQVGAMQRQLEAATAFARDRRQFGKPIGQFQSVSNRIADMKLRLETSRLLLYRAAWCAANQQPYQMDAALANLHLSESYVQSSLDQIRVHGGRGFLTTDGVERDLRDGVGGLIYSGTSDIQRNIIAQLLGLR